MALFVKFQLIKNQNCQNEPVAELCLIQAKRQPCSGGLALPGTIAEVAEGNGLRSAYLFVCSCCLKNNDGCEDISSKTTVSKKQKPVTSSFKIQRQTLLALGPNRNPPKHEANKAKLFGS